MGEGFCKSVPAAWERAPRKGAGRLELCGQRQKTPPNSPLPLSLPPLAPREKPLTARPATAEGPARGFAPGRSVVSFARKCLVLSVWRVD